MAIWPPAERVPKASAREPMVVHLDRQRLETLTQDLVDRTAWACESVVREAKWSVDEIDLVMMIGGQTRMPRIRAQLSEVCGKNPVDVAGSDLVVAMGAAQHAATLARAGRGRGRFRVPDPITELTSLSLGLESAGGVFTRLIPRGAPLPATRTQVIATSTDGQTQIVMHLLEGEREMAADNESVARIQIGPLPARPRGEIQLEVDIVSDGSGLPTAQARIVESGEVKQTRVRPSAGLVEAEILALTAAHAGGLTGHQEGGALLSDLGSSDLAGRDLPGGDLGSSEGEHEAGAIETADPSLLQGG